MMKKTVLKSFLLIIFYLVSSCKNKEQEPHKIFGQFNGAIHISKVELQQFGVEISRVKDTPVNNNKFSLTIPPSLKEGMYKLKYYEGEQSSSFDLIITNKKDVDFEITLSKTEFINPTFKNSEINTLYFNKTQHHKEIINTINATKNQWAKLANKTSQKADSLSQIIESLIEENNKSISNINDKYSFIKLLIKNSFRTPYFNKTLSPKQQDSVYISTYWENVEPNKPQLLNSTVYSSAIYNFVNYTMLLNSHLTHDKQVQKTKESVDTVLKHFTNYETRNFAINYLSFGFKQLGREDILQYIDENYASFEQCENPESLKTRLEGYAKIKAGNKAPDLIFEGINILEPISDTTLIVFWATWCEHCRQEIPLLNQYQQKHNLQVISISLDTDQNLFREVKSQMPNFTHYSDLKKWDSPNVKAYYVNGTPTFVLIDGDKNIIGKYISINDVISVIEK